MTIREKMEKILMDYIRLTLLRGKDRPLVRRGIRKETIEKLISLFHQELQACMPKEKPLNIWSLIKLRDEAVGWNRCFSTIQEALKERGLWIK